MNIPFCVATCRKTALNYSLRRLFSFLDRPPVERPLKLPLSYIQQGFQLFDGCLILSRIFKENAVLDLMVLGASNFGYTPENKGKRKIALYKY